MMKKFILLVVFALGLICFTSRIANAQKVVGYTTSWQGSANDIQYDKLTHINYSFALPTASGGLEPIANEAKLISVVNQAHAAGVKVLIAVGGWDIGDGGGNDSRFTTLAANPSTRTTFINNLMSFVAQYNLDGVDMDWEYPDPIDNGPNPDYTALMTELGAALHAQGKELSAAVVALGYTAAGVGPGVFNAVDHLNIMAYDGGNGAAHSPYSYAQDALNYWLGRGLPAAKAIVGVPFYARPSWKAYSTLLAEGADPYADTWGSDYYNGITTIQAKTDLAVANAGGIMIWELGHDVNNQFSLLSAISERIIPPCTSGCAPNLSITAPDAEIGMQTLSAVELAATATDNDGTISSVVFNIDNQNFNGAASGSNYSASWTPSAYGVFTLSVTATDNNNQTTTKQRTVEIKACTAPEFDPTKVYLAGDQALYQGDIWEAKWWTQGGTPPTLDAWKYVRPCGGNTGIAPTISITSPAPNTAFDEGQAITFTADASDQDGTVTQVEFFAGSTSLGVDQTAPYSVVWNNAAVGSYEITAVATDNDNLTASATLSLIHVNPIIIDPPVVEITSPANGSTFDEGIAISITAAASDPANQVVSVEFFAGSVSIGLDNTEPYSIVWTGAPRGDHVLTAVATNNENVSATSNPVNITVGYDPIIPPTATITAPAEGTEYIPGDVVNIAVAATDSDGTITQVEFFEGSNSIGVDLTAPYTLAWTPTYPGPYALTAVATDNHGAPGTSNVVNIVLVGNTTCTAPAWEPGAVYNSGDTVSHQGNEWKAKWWTTNEEPGTTGQWGVWEDLGPCPQMKASSTISLAETHAYPNPFNEKLCFAFELEEAGKVSILLTSVNGQASYQLMNASLDPGKHQMDFDSQALETGMYIYQVTINNGSVQSGMLIKR